MRRGYKGAGCRTLYPGSWVLDGWSSIVGTAAAMRRFVTVTFVRVFTVGGR